MFLSAKTINLLGIILVFFGLMTLMLVHLNHHQASEKETEEEHESDQWFHIAIGFPASVVGALLLVLAEKRAV